VRHAKRHQRQLAVVFLDLDHFKHINDSMGHPSGDRLLKQVASVLAGCVRQDDTVARLGGDEFVLLMEDITGPEQVVIVAQKLLEEFNQPLMVDQTQIGVTASLGISLYPQDGETADELMRNADSAMYRAKARGRNTYHFYTEELTRKAYERILFESDLRQALSNQEFSLLYQPQVSLDDRRIVGVEALLRWNHKKLGVISPAKFIPLAEESGLIVPLGDWVLHEACRQARLWLDDGVQIGRIAVNVAGPQILRKTFLDSVSGALEDSGLSPENLELEITENFIMQGATPAIEQLEALRSMGVQIAIDDFGTGYSSLSYLKRLPVHKLKIDQSFVRDIPDDSDDMAISRAVIALAKEMGMTSIAEGVETRAQADYLIREGCDEAQGYLFSHPITAEQIERFKIAFD
jgi:diguanylate cyclase (GGDEF)-like protein